jgi:hypothetical protein
MPSTTSITVRVAKAAQTAGLDNSSIIHALPLAMVAAI